MRVARRFRSIQKSFSLSILLHAFLVLVWIVVGQVSPQLRPSTPKKVTYIDLESITPKKPSNDSKQVVTSQNGQTVKEALPDAFLGEKNQVVDRQTVSTQTIGSAESKPVVKKSLSPTMATKALSKARIQATTQNTTQDSTPKTQTVAEKITLSKLGVALPAPGLRPGEGEVARAVEEEGALNNQVQGDYVKGMRESDRTLLNTREFVFYGYFQRIRERLDHAWDRSLREKMEKYFYQGRHLANETDYTTKLLVTLDNGGQITKVQVLGQSGAKDLDDAAIKAFNDAGPFPNPPQGLVDSSGKIQVRWDFVLRT